MAACGSDLGVQWVSLELEIGIDAGVGIALDTGDAWEWSFSCISFFGSVCQSLRCRLVDG
jgi:hypothetical protein